MKTLSYGAAGRKDAASRSDCFCEVTVTETGGIAIELASKVEALYGDSIRRLAADVLRQIGIRHARVAIEDRGAVPFVIAARIEAAAAHALERSVPAFLLPQRIAPLQSERKRLRRTRLYLPGNEPRFFLNAGLHAPDGIILDLEDSVAPAEKDAARILVRNALRAIDSAGAERMVRINSGAMGLDDLRAVVPQGVDVVLIPKCEQAADVASVAEEIASISHQSKLGHPVWLLPIVESARGVMRASEIAAASDTICALAIGLEDYCADIGAERTREGEESAYARGAIVNAACAAGVEPLDSVFSDVADTGALHAHARKSRALGFKGMGCIHPRQIAVVHDAFAPEAGEIEKAGRIVLAYEDAVRAGSGVTVLNGKMIDMPVVNRAQHTLKLAEALGLVSKNWKSEHGACEPAFDQQKEQSDAE
jgi:citrate lyase subunit beta / citryl-CoA lyase